VVLFIFSENARKMSTAPAAKRAKTSAQPASSDQVTAATDVMGNYFADDVIGPFPQARLLQTTACCLVHSRMGSSTGWVGRGGVRAPADGIYGDQVRLLGAGSFRRRHVPLMGPKKGDPAAAL